MSRSNDRAKRRMSPGYTQDRIKRRQRRKARKLGLNPDRAAAPPIRLLTRDDLDRWPSPPIEDSGKPRCFACGTPSENVIWVGDLCLDCAGDLDHDSA